MKRIFQKTVGKLTGSTRFGAKKIAACVLGANAGAAIRGSYRSLPEVSTYILICSGEPSVLAQRRVGNARNKPRD